MSVSSGARDLASRGSQCTESSESTSKTRVIPKRTLDGRRDITIYGVDRSGTDTDARAPMQEQCLLLEAGVRGIFSVRRNTRVLILIFIEAEGRAR